jgi:hypothetical protein
MAISDAEQPTPGGRSLFPAVVRARVFLALWLLLLVLASSLAIVAAVYRHDVGR